MSRFRDLEKTAGIEPPSRPVPGEGHLKPPGQRGEEIDPRDVELAQLRQVVANRSTTAVDEWSDGIAFMLQAAEAGDPGAVALVNQLNVHLDRLRAVRSRIVIPR